MKDYTIIRLSSFVCLAFALILGGCASSDHYKGEAVVEGLQQAADRIAKAQTTRIATMAALNDLMDNPQPDLRPQFKKFISLLEDWQSEIQDVESKSTGMQSKGAEYFEKWDKELAKLQNEDIRNRSLARKEALTRQFEKIAMAYQAVAKTRGPLMSDLSDIRIALSADLTRAGLEAVKPVAKKANKNSGYLGEAVDKLVQEFQTLGLTMSAVTPAAKK